MPLENQTVRFIDNFSAGTRGATSAEYFLSQGYAVIFLHRQFSLLPFSRHYSHSTNCFLDFLSEWGRIGEDDEDGGKNGGQAATPDVVVKAKYRQEMLSVLRKYRKAKEQNLLLLLPFTTVTSYLFTLRALACEMQCLGNEALFYLAAAVSDFFVPPSRMAEHKIQSGDIPSTDDDSGGGGGGGKKLVVDLDPVPKFLKRLVEQWAPQAMIVSFKVCSIQDQINTPPLKLTNSRGNSWKLILPCCSQNAGRASTAIHTTLLLETSSRRASVKSYLWTARARNGSARQR